MVVRGPAARGTTLAWLLTVRPLQRKVTVRGLGSSFPASDGVEEFDVDDAFNDDVVVAPPAPASGQRARVSCPPPSGSTPTSTRYTFIASRPRQTLSMLAVPVPSDDAPISRRRPTLRTYEVQQDVRDADADEHALASA